MNRYESLELFDYSIFISKLDDIELGSKCIINTLNQNAFTVAEYDETFKKALVESDILLPDGVGIVAAAKLLKGVKIKKVAGSDVHLHLLKKLNERGGNCFYLGSHEATLKNIKSRLAKEFPNINMGYYSPPFKPSFSAEDSAIMIDYINAFQPEVLFIGMTAPKQEKWAFENHHQVDANVICSVGAVFDFYAGTVNRPGQVWINLGLEWLIRLIRDPARTWKRYIYYGPVFVVKILSEKIRSF